MASTRKTRKVYKKFAKINDEWPEKDGPSTANKNKNKKRKLVDLLGPQWSKEELEHFYDAYRKYGKDWKKVSGSLGNRTADMAEALYNLNRAYLSLPEGAATAAGLIAMMTDHYSNLVGSHSDSENEESPKKLPSKPPPKRVKGKQKTESKASKSRYPDLLSYEPASSSFADLSALKRKRSGGTRPRAVRKRTPRVPVATIKNRINNRLDSPSIAGKTEDDEGAMAAKALAEVIQISGSLHVAHTPSRQAATVKIGSRKNANLERDSSKTVVFHAERESSPRCREAENEASPKGPSYTPRKGVAAGGGGKTGPKSKKSQKKKHKGIIADRSHDEKEACSDTEEGHNSSSGKALRVAADDEDAKSPRASTSSQKRDQQLSCGEDEADALSALYTLANATELTPTSESESSAHVKDDNKDIDSKAKQSKPKGSTKKDKRKADGVGPDGGARKRTKAARESATPVTKDSTVKPEKGKKRKPTPSKILKDEAKTEMPGGEFERAKFPVEEKATSGKGRRASQASPVSKAAEGSIYPVELSPSISGPTRAVIDVSETSTGTAQLQTKSRSRRKSGILKAFSKRVGLLSETTANKRPAYCANSAVDLKEKLSHCLSNSLFRRWCRFEWFYSAIDYPWFAQNEFVEYLNHVKLGHIPTLMRAEWGVIRGSLGKPRRLSAYLLKEERTKLAKYRESVREHYSSLLTGKLEGLPIDLARPLTVGQRVIACHPRSRELHDGSVLTVDGDCCRVQFDRPDLGVEFVMDIDCMPLNPVENMPDALRRQHVHATKFGYPRSVVQANDWRAGALARVSPSRSYDILGGPSHVSTSHPMSILTQAKGDSIDAVAQAKATLNEAAMVARQAMYNQSCSMSQIQEREADIRALAELSRALDKKEALLMELRYMNEEISGTQEENDNLSDLEHFRSHYATVLVQLREANDQVANALCSLRERNTYSGNPANPLPRSTETHGALSDSFYNVGLRNAQDTGTQVVEIIENSRRKAKMMVDAAVQVINTTSEGENPAVKIEEALDSLSNRNGSGSSILGIRRIPPDSGHAHSTYQQENAASATFDPSSVNAESPKMHIFEREIRIPSELISSCVSTLLMIQSCTEKQQPPADVAHILDSALASMQPCCPENAGLFGNIEMYMGMIKNLMLARIPTPTPTPTLPIPITLLPSELPPL